MKAFDVRTPCAKRVGATSATLVALFSAGLLVALVGGAQAASTPVPLGTADSFVVLAGAGITNTGPTTVNGDLGTYPTTTITGTASMTVTGTNHAGDAVTQGAKTDLVTAYNTAAGEGPTSPIAADLGGQTLTAASTTPPPRSGSPERSRSTPPATRTRSSSSRPARR